MQPRSSSELLPTLSGKALEAGCDEAGRGCLAGPVVAAAVILPPGFSAEGLDDSKRMSPASRYAMRDLIIDRCLAWGIGLAGHREIDEVNILQASIRAMHRALAKLQVTPEHIVVDGIHFHPYGSVEHTCVVKGDSRYASVAAASVLAKTFRDDIMRELHQEFPEYAWDRNKGYPTPSHRTAIAEHGLSPFHRRSFGQARQLEIPLGY